MKYYRYIGKIDEIPKKYKLKRKKMVSPMSSQKISINDILQSPAIDETQANPSDTYAVINREKSWIDFNTRVLSLSINNNIPLFERLNFLGISESNLDEFVMVRMGKIYSSLKEEECDPLDKILFKNLKERCADFIAQQYKVLNSIISNDFVDAKIKLLEYSNLNEEQILKVNKIFDDKIYPILTPLVLGTGNPFPLIKSCDINMAVIVDDKFVTVQIPSDIDKLFYLGDTCEGSNFITLEEILKNNLAKLFSGKAIREYAIYKVLRNAYIDIPHETKLVDAMKKSLKARERGNVLILKITKCNHKLLKAIYKSLNAKKDSIVKVEHNSIIDLNFAKGFIEISSIRPELKYDKFTPQKPEQLIGESDIFNVLDDEDILLHHPYEKFDPVVNLIETAANDPSVISIKQTLYRVDHDSPIIKALDVAIANGKYVTIIFEVKARFNEKENIEWATRLEKHGCHIIYGSDKLKSHCKLTLITRKTKKGNFKSYAHIGTGNYNTKTSKAYTDLGLLTTNKNIILDLVSIFNMLTGCSSPTNLNRMIYSPNNIKDTLLELLDHEIGNVLDGKDGKVIFKCNSLTDIDIANKIYEAASKGVNVTLIIRGVCIVKKRENIYIKSILGRYLEHSRIYYFYNDGDANVYIASADCMERNLKRRFEAGVLVKGHNKKKIIDILDIFIRDNVNSFEMQEDDTFKLKEYDDSNKFNCHEIFMKRAKKPQVNFNIQ